MRKECVADEIFVKSEAEMVQKQFHGTKPQSHKGTERKKKALFVFKWEVVVGFYGFLSVRDVHGAILAGWSPKCPRPQAR